MNGAICALDRGGVPRDVAGMVRTYITQSMLRWRMSASQLPRFDPARIQFEPRRSRRQILKLYNEIDIALDTFPCAGHTTTLDAI